MQLRRIDNSILARFVQNTSHFALKNTSETIENMNICGGIGGAKVICHVRIDVQDISHVNWPLYAAWERASLIRKVSSKYEFWRSHTFSAFSWNLVIFRILENIFLSDFLYDDRCRVNMTYLSSCNHCHKKMLTQWQWKWPKCQMLALQQHGQIIGTLCRDMTLFKLNNINL